MADFTNADKGFDYDDFNKEVNENDILMESYNPSLPFEERNIKVLFSKPLVFVN